MGNISNLCQNDSLSFFSYTELQLLHAFICQIIYYIPTVFQKDLGTFK